MNLHENSARLNNYRPDIDGLRAFAVSAVVAYHAFPDTLRAGFIGVDVFFVISGYLISGIILNDLERGTFSLWNFYSRRIRRIFPALIVVLSAVLIFGWFALFSYEYLALGKHVFSGSSFITNFILWFETGYFDVAAKSKPLLHLWSLGIEEQFYIVFPLLLLCCSKKCIQISTIIIVLCIASFFDNIYSITRPIVNFYNPLARAWELLAGATLCVVMRRATAHYFFDALAKVYLHKTQEHDGRRLRFVLALLGISLLCLALLLVQGDNPYPGWQALLPVLGTLLMIAAGTSNPINKYLMGNRVVVFIGLISYPLYLWHWPLISYAFIIFGELDSHTWLFRVGLVVTSFILAVLTYYLVERPIRFGIRARTKGVFALLIGMVIVGGSGLTIYLTDGAPRRKNIKVFADIIKQFEPVIVSYGGGVYGS